MANWTDQFMCEARVEPALKTSHCRRFAVPDPAQQTFKIFSTNHGLTAGEKKKNKLAFPCISLREMFKHASNKVELWFPCFSLLAFGGHFDPVLGNYFKPFPHRLRVFSQITKTIYVPWVTSDQMHTGISYLNDQMLQFLFKYTGDIRRAPVLGKRTLRHLYLNTEN